MMVSRNPRIALIIVNFNGGDALLKCLGSVQAQTHPADRVLVFDNASADGSMERAELAFPNVEYVRSKRNLGFAAANNRAVELTRDCDWIALLNPDAYPAHDWIGRLRHAIVKFPDYAAFGCRLLMDHDPTLLDGVGDAYHVCGLPWRVGHGQGARDRFLQPVEIFSPCAAAALYDRHEFVDSGGFDEDFFCYMEDVDLGFRLRLRGRRSLYLPDAVVRHTGSGITGRHSSFSVYHGQRNLVWTFIKDVPSPWLWIFLPMHMLLNVASVAAGGLPALRAKADALKGLRRMWRKRRAIQKARRVPLKAIAAQLTFGVLPILQQLHRRLTRSGEDRHGPDA